MLRHQSKLLLHAPLRAMAKREVSQDIPLETAPPSKEGTLVSDEEQGSKASSEDVAVVESGTAASSLKTSEKCSAKDGS